MIHKRGLSKRKKNIPYLTLTRKIKNYNVTLPHTYWNNQNQDTDTTNHWGILWDRMFLLLLEI